MARFIEKKPQPIINAFKLKKTIRIQYPDYDDKDTWLTLNKGDWLIIDENDVLAFTSDNYFKKNYEGYDESAKKYLERNY